MAVSLPKKYQALENLWFIISSLKDEGFIKMILVIQDCSGCGTTKLKAAALERRAVVGALPVIQAGYSLRRGPQHRHMPTMSSREMILIRFSHPPILLVLLCFHQQRVFSL